MKNGDYVLATKWSDGDPQDRWCVGFYHEFRNNLHYVKYKSMTRAFRRVQKIKKETGILILENISQIENSYKSLWFWKRFYNKYKD